MGSGRGRNPVHLKNCASYLVGFRKSVKSRVAQHFFDVGNSTEESRVMLC